MNDAYMAETALAIQDACNASGVVYALERFAHELTANHPVVILFADKLDDLCRCRDKDTKPATTLPEVMAAFKAVMDRLCEQSHREGHGTDWRNQHPDCQELVLQLVYLTRSRNGFSAAYDACQQMMAASSKETI